MRYVEGSGGGGSSRKPTESADNLKSIPYARMLVVTSEGEVGGIIGGDQGIYFDDVPLRSADGSVNFEGVAWQQRYGTPDQDVIKGFSENEAVINFPQIEATTTQTPEKTVGYDVDAVKVVIMLPALMQQQSDGDLRPMEVEFAIETTPANNILWTQAKHVRFSAKASSPVQIQYKIGRPLDTDVAAREGWLYRVVRISPDATSQKIQNKTFLVSHTEVREQRLTYPNSALLGVVANLEQFGNRVPNVAIDLEGIKVKVPANYFQDANGVPEYRGVWNGDWKYAATDNPAWHLRNLIVEDVRPDGSSNKRYSLGLPAGVISDAELYAIAQYCDCWEDGTYSPLYVTDPETGQVEQIRRFTLNTIIGSARSAFEWLSTIAATARCAIFHAGGQVYITQDRPKTAIASFTNSNVEEGKFVRGSTARIDRITACHVTYNDPADNYKQAVESYEDEAATSLYGLNEANITLFTTSSAEAYMMAKWVVESTLHEKHVVTFKTGMDAADLLPGDVIEIYDNNFALPGSRGSTRIAGRIKGGTNTTIIPDQAVYLTPGQSYSVTIIRADGEGYETRDLVNDGQGNYETLTVTVPFSDPVAVNHVFAVRGTDIQPERYRVIRKTQSDKMTFEIIGHQYDDDKYSRVEYNVPKPRPPFQRVAVKSISTPQAPTLTQRSRVDTLGQPHLELHAAWTEVEGAVRYQVVYSRDQEDSLRALTTLPEYTIRDAQAGEYEVRVQAINAAGVESVASPPSVYTISLSETTTLQPPVSLSVKGGGSIWTGRALNLSWAHNNLNDDVTDSVLAKYQIRFLNPADASVVRTVTVPSSQYEYIYSWEQNVADGGPRRELIVEVRSMDVAGGTSDPATLTANNPAPSMPTGVTFDTSMLDAYRVNYSAPADADWAGTVVHHSTTSPVTPSATNQAATGTGTSIDVEANRNQTYYVTFAHYDEFGQYGLNFYPQSEVITRTTAYAVPATPINIVITESSRSVGGIVQYSIHVTWDAVADVTAYEVEITEGAAAPVIFTTSATSYTYSAAPNTSYGVRVRSRNVDQLSVWSAVVNHTTGADVSIVRVYDGFYEPNSVALTATMAEVVRLEIDSGNQPVGGTFGAHVSLDVPTTAGTYYISAQVKKNNTVIRGPYNILVARQETGGAAWTESQYVSLPMNDPFVGAGLHSYTLELSANATASVDHAEGWISS